MLWAESDVEGSLGCTSSDLPASRPMQLTPRSMMRRESEEASILIPLQAGGGEEDAEPGKGTVTSISDSQRTSREQKTDEDNSADAHGKARAQTRGGEVDAEPGKGTVTSISASQQTAREQPTDEDNSADANGKACAQTRGAESASRSPRVDGRRVNPNLADESPLVTSATGQPGIKARVIQSGDVVSYVEADGSETPAQVVEVHTDDGEPYYTVLVHGVERSTERDRLRTPGEGAQVQQSRQHAVPAQGASGSQGSFGSQGVGASHGDVLLPGCHVRLHGLQSESGKRNNGKLGVLRRFDGAKGRWVVAFDGNEGNLREENLQHVSSPNLCGTYELTPSEEKAVNDFAGKARGGKTDDAVLKGDDDPQAVKAFKAEREVLAAKRKEEKFAKQLERDMHNAAKKAREGAQ